VSAGHKAGDVVTVERDEKRWPSRGSWPRYRGRTAMVVSLNRPAGEVGVTFTRIGATDLASCKANSWFLAHELIGRRCRTPA
jgi:hypothetical protein